MKMPNESAKPGKATQKLNCSRIRDLLLDEACGRLAEPHRAAVEAHLSECADCATGFQRAQSLLQTIDENLRESVAVEPSPEFAARVRQEIANERRRGLAWKPRKAWLTAAAACAALGLFLFATLTVRRPARREIPRPRFAATSPSTPQPELRTAPPRSAESAKANPHRVERFASRKPTLANGHENARHALLGNTEPALPKVIVQPGQMKAILQFVAEVQKGQINGAQIAKEMKASDRPIRIKPLVIKPLEVPPIDAPNSTQGSGTGAGGQNFVTGQSN